MLAHFLSVVAPLDFGVEGNILKMRTAWWPLLMLLSFTSSMSGREFSAQRKLAFHVFGSLDWPSTYLPASMLFSLGSFPSKKQEFSALLFTVCMYIPLSHLCGWPTFWTNLRPCPAPSHAELHASRELRTLSFPVKKQKTIIKLEQGCLHIQHGKKI